ncbi:MAG TPA: response regulator [Steroidobacteraceae bacterium]|nr:response regulator [Steroidobacteraceae bacterium]
MQPTVYFVDDDAAVRDAISLLLSLKGFLSQVFASAETFLETYRPEWRGVLLTDLRMAGMSGLDLQRELAARGVLLPVVVMTAHGDVNTTREAMKAGAYDFIEKPADDAVLVDVLRNAIAHDAENHKVEAVRQVRRERLDRLTPRERDVARLLSQGMQNRQIATELGISPRTVEVYKARMMEKLDCRNLADVLRVTSGLADAADA